MIQGPLYVASYGHSSRPVISDEAAYAIATGDVSYLKKRIEQKEKAAQSLKDHPEYLAYGVVGICGLVIVSFFVCYLLMKLMELFFG